MDENQYAHNLRALGEVAIDGSEVDSKGFDINAIAKTIHNAYLARRIHNADISEPVSGSLVIEIENPKYHNEPTPLHTKFVGSILRYWTWVEEDLKKDSIADQTLGYEEGYINDLLSDDAENEEVVIRKNLFRLLSNKVELHFNLGGESFETNALVLWGYLHDVGKIFRPYIKSLSNKDGQLVIKKDQEGNTIKTPNRLNMLASGLNPKLEEEHEYLEFHTITFIDLLGDSNIISHQMRDFLKSLHSEYAKLSFLVKGERGYKVPDELSYIQKLALVGLVADELGKGIHFEDQSAINERISKLEKVEFLVNEYL